MLYSSLVAASFLLVVSYILYRHRGFFVDLLPDHIQDRLPVFLRPSLDHPHGGMLGRLFSSSPPSAARYSRLGNFDWGNSLRAGLNSSLFDIEANVRDGDQRSGLDERGAMDVQGIMQQYGVSFDEARLIRHKQILASNNIDPLTGLPLDSKAALSSLFTVLTYVYIFGVSYSSRTYLSLGPLTLGVMLACSSRSINTNDAVGSTFIFVAQNIYSKKLLRRGDQAKQDRQLRVMQRPEDAKMDKLNVLFYASGCSMVLVIPVVLYYDSHVLFASTASQERRASTHTILSLILANGVVHFLQNILAFSILSLVSPVTYSIASLLKRIVVIVLFILWFRQQVRFLQVVGIVMTFLGLWLYNDAKTREDVGKGEMKMRKRETEGALEGVLPTKSGGEGLADRMTQQQWQRQHQQGIYDRIAKTGRPAPPPRMGRGYHSDLTTRLTNSPHSDRG